MILKAEENIVSQRLRLTICGAVQGVGFRPFVFTCAESCDLRGFVGNESGGVFVEIEGLQDNLINFQKLLRENAPPLAHIISIEIEEIPATNETDFRIVESKTRESENTVVSPDASVCADCRRELFDENDRRFRYPFINCTNCGTRFTIIKDIPYDRPNTTMSAFQMCALCRSEYDNPLSRRFHAQPNACRNCGARIWFARKNEKDIYDENAILATQKVLSENGIVAVKGVGGFHLACDANSDAALRILRERKGRIDKPFAVMCRDLGAAERLVEIGDAERILLTGKERPIVLLRKKQDRKISELIAPRNLFLGVMLPYSPLHYLLLNSTSEKFHNLNVLVMTSGNFSSEPIVKDNAEALEKLSPLADAFLLHDRDIHVSCDDSVVRVFEEDLTTENTERRNKTEKDYPQMNTDEHEFFQNHLKNPVKNFSVNSVRSVAKSFHELPIRRSRGYAPFPVQLPFKVPPILAVGGELKATFCVAKDRFAFMSQHIGDMGNLETLRAFEKSVGQMRKLFRVEPEIIAFDKHPNYLSARWAKDNLTRLFQPETKLVAVQHHHAHIASVMAENGLNGAERIIGFAFDGTGYGDDGAIWGGEVLLADYARFERAAHLRYFPLAGGDASVKKPYRVALAHLWQAGIDWSAQLPCVAACSETEKKILRTQFENNFNAVRTSSFGRLFDAVASLAGVRQTITYEAQAAIEFEAALDETISDAYEFDLIEGEIIQIDCAKLISEVAKDVLAQISVAEISAKFNNAVADLILRLALKFRTRENLNKVALSGGCFQNVALLRASLRRLRENDFEVLTHRQVPPNDGGLALGQAVIAAFSQPKS
ncbi:MAG TPA: carbamoyltransferase HypF [Pyrinomonadaceae bacterium]|nr:carbamoyltransferase HypF [Pyrinomonadaceae bacterium]